jgi:hypothetical protein
MFGITYAPLGAAIQTFVLLAIQAALMIGSTIITTRLNNVAVVFEIVGMVELSIVLFAAALLAGQGDWGNLWSTGTVPEAGWFSWLGPVMLATVLGSFTLLGFESAANFAEETQEPRRGDPGATSGGAQGDDPGAVGSRRHRHDLPHRGGRGHQGRGRHDGGPGAARVHPRGCPRTEHPEGLPVLHLRLDVLLRFDHHGHQRPAGVGDGS